MVKYASLIAVIWVSLLVTTAAQAADVNASLDRNRIVEGETVTLVFETNDPQQSLDGDFSLLNRDFEILDQRSETQMSIVNGRQSAVVRLVLTLEPRNAGVFVIPPLRFGSATTDPLQLTVEAAPEPTPGEAPTVFIEVDVEPKQGPYYVHAQFRLTVRVFYQQSLTEAAISQPEPTSASVRLLDEVPFQAERSGQRYKVLERHYAVFPERSGPLVIPPMKLSGRLVERRANDRLWQPAVRGRRIETSSEQVDLDILPKPASFTGADWIPARALQMSQNISAGDSLKVGEPVTRTIIVDAVGLEENMITAPPWPEIPDARIYPDQPQGISRNDGKWVLGHKEFRYAIVPEKEGELVLPELKLEWWDTLNNRAGTAVLPEKRIRVMPSTVVPQTPPAGPLPAAPEPVDLPVDTVAAVSQPGASYWTWLTFLFAALWVITLVLLIRRKNGHGSKPTVKSSELPGEGEVLNALKAACQANDAGRVRRDLNRWLRSFGPAGSSGSLLDFANQHADQALGELLVQLDADGFRPDASGAWNGSALWKAFSSWRTQWLANQKNREAPVMDLYARPA